MNLNDLMLATVLAIFSIGIVLPMAIILWKDALKELRK